MISRTLALILILFSSFVSFGQCFIQVPLKVCQGNCGPALWLLNDPPGTTYSWTIGCGTITNPNAANPHIVCFNNPGLCRIDVIVTRPGQEPDTCTSYTIVEPTSEEQIVEVICQGDSVEVNGMYYKAGTYRDTIFGGNINQCDSFLVIVVGEIQPMLDTISTLFCSGSGDSIVVNGTTYNENNPSGSEAIMGTMCIETIVTIDLTYAPSTASTQSYTGCHDDGYSIVVGSNTYNESNPSGIDTITNANGCDSFVTTFLIFLPLSLDTIAYNGCTGDSFSIIVDSILYNETNPTGTDTLTAANGCDSIITINLVFNPPTQDTITYNGCQGDGFSVIVMDSLFNESNPAGIITFQTSHCDSIIVIDLHFIDCPDSLLISGHDICVSGTGSQYSWYSCYGLPLPDTTQCITVADTGCVCVSFTDGSGFDTLCLQYNLCELNCQINAPAKACVGEIVMMDFTSNDSTLEVIQWTIKLDSTNTQVYTATDSVWLTFAIPGCYPVELILQDSGCISICTDTVCIVEKPSAFICCDQIQCDSCASISVYLTGQVPFSIAITNGITTDTINEIIDTIYNYLACQQYDTTLTYTLLWMNDAGGACNADIFTPSATVYLEPKPVAVISLHGDTLCVEPSGQFYHWVDCDNLNSFGFDQCFVPQASGCYCVTVTTAITDCQDTACINYIISGTQDINEPSDIRMHYEPSLNSILFESPDKFPGNLNVELVDLSGRMIHITRKENPDDHSIRIYLPEHMPSIVFASLFSEKFRYTNGVFIY
ncbi:MAG TPA: hypothetical protein VFG10_11845 [Saprospiraceae bacterium]|nr:hypothetical protein [Saprospiraceae bacterium]